MTTFPTFDNIKLNDYDIVGGFYTLGFLRKHMPDCLFVTYDQWQDYHDYKWLQNIIEQNLKEKIICILPWDESILGRDNFQLSNMLNQYTDEKVFWITQLSSNNQKIYQHQNNINFKILELPWWLLNDVLTYYEVKKSDKSSLLPTSTDYNYLCMIGNAFSKHKTWLVEHLIRKNLDRYGLITVLDYKDYPEYFKKHVHINPVTQYQNKQIGCFKQSNWSFNSVVSSIHQTDPTPAQKKLGDVWISKNVENFCYIEKTYNMPLIINPETSPGIFFSTEKSIWPILLGKLYLIYGGPGSMAWLQQFYDIDQKEFCDVEFDSIAGFYTEDDHKDRLNSMIDTNFELIKNSKEIYDYLRPRLESSRWTFGRKLYDFFINQLLKIK